MTVTIDRAHAFLVYRDSNAVADAQRIERGHTFLVTRDSAAVADVQRIERAHAFLVIYNENQTDSQVAIRRAHTFLVIRKANPVFSVSGGDQLTVDWPIPGSYMVNIRASDVSGHFDKTLSITINEDITRNTRFSNGFSNGFEQ